MAGTFAVEILGKRLLSCPTAFAESWRRCKEGLAEAEAASDADVESARTRGRAGDRRRPRDAGARGDRRDRRRRVAQERRDRTEGRDRRHRRGTRRAWLARSHRTQSKQIRATMPGSMRSLSMIERLLRRTAAIGEMTSGSSSSPSTRPPSTISCVGYARSTSEERILTLFGSGGTDGMDQDDRDRVKNAFNDPTAHGPVSARHRRGGRGPQPPEHRALPLALRLSVESIEARAAERAARSSRTGARRHRALLRQ